MGKKPYSDPRWWDNPMPKDSACGNCKFYQGFLKCEKYDPKIPMDILDQSFPGTVEFNEAYCPYRIEGDLERETEKKFHHSKNIGR